MEELRCVAADGRQHLESLFKWFRKLALGDAAARDVPLSDEDRGRVSAVLQARHACAHVGSMDWLSAVGLGCFFRSDDGASETASPVSLPPQPLTKAYALDTQCHKCTSTHRGLPALLSALSAAWEAQLLKGRTAAMIKPVVSLSVGTGALCTASAIHTDFSTSWKFCDGSAGSVGSLVAALPTQVDDQCVVNCVRIASLAHSGVVRMEVCRIAMPAQHTVHRCEFYGHVRDPAGALRWFVCIALSLRRHPALKSYQMNRSCWCTQQAAMDHPRSY